MGRFGKMASGVASHAKNAGIANSIMRHKGRTAVIGAAGFIGVNSMRGRRGPGVSKSTGRPTGMYKY
jgi:hypothetical protein